MPGASQLDSLEITELALPYDKASKILDDTPRLIPSSLNIYVDRQNRVRKCGGLVDQSLDIAGHRVDRLIDYDAENGRKYLVASCYDTANTNWTVYYLRLDGASAWTEIPDLRNVRDSEYPHEMVAARGQVFIKGFPGAAGDKLGSVIFDGRSTPVTSLWGLLGPSVAARRSGATSGWSASTTNHDVLVGWKYVYSWVTTTGHESSRSPLETDPAVQPSDTEVFSNKIPNMVLQGHADTTNIPYINVYRTYDGGGTFLFLQQVTNTGAGNITYLDNDRTTTPGDPMTDSQLDSARPAASLTSNSPPPTVEEGTIGTDTVERCSPLAYWNGRIWYGVGRNLYFSGNDEIRAGNNEEAWPTGVVTGNRIRMRGAIRKVVPKKRSLSAATSKESIEVRGSARQDILGDLVLSSVGAADQRRGFLGHEDTEFWFDQNTQLRGMENQQSQVLSESLDNDIISALDTDTHLSLAIYQAPQIDWLIAALHDNGTPANSRWWVLDLSRLNRGMFWSPPWVKDTSALVQSVNEAGVSKLYATVFTGGNTKLTVYTDTTYADLGTGYAFSIEPNMMSLPDGNHVHRLAKPRLMCPVMEMKLGYIGNAPTVKYALDSAGAYTATAVANDPPRVTAGDAGYAIKHYPIGKVAQRAKIQISRTADTNSFFLESMAITWDPTGGD